MYLLKYLSFTFALTLSQITLADDNRKHYYTDIPGVEANVLIKTTTSWNGTKLPSYGEGQSEITIIRYRFAPGASIPMHMHPVINAGVLLKGELNIFTKTGEKITLKAGEPLVELFKEWHYGSNPGTEAVDLIVVYAGTVGTPLTIREK
jgi:quercetin dioxygenase-like cupin family protein